MSFGTFGSGSASSPAGSGTVQAGDDLQEIQSTELEFSGFNGETKIQLLPSAWPESELPPPTSSLLSVASKAGLLAAGGQDSVIVAKLDAVREAFGQKEGDGNIKPFQPQLMIPVGIRVSQVAFSADGSCLAISAEQGGGIAAYDVGNLLQGNTNSAFELASDGQSLRCLAPNPAPESAELFAAVTTKGQLLIADMKSHSWRKGQNGNVLQEGASAVAWSTRGKALLVGLGDGSIVQLKSDGTPMSRVPRPPKLEGDKHVSSISWLENDLALIVYTPSSDGMADPSDFYIWERTPKSNPPVHKFSKLPEIASGWGDRTPAHQFMSRLKDFHNCNQIVLVSTTPSEDVGIVSRSTVPLAEGAPVNTFTSTTQVNDSRRANLPMKADMSASTTPIGMDIDLASTKTVPRPIPGDEYDESPGPLPGLLILNTDGVLAAWWLVYADAIRKGISYPDLVVNQSNAPPASAQPSQIQSGTTAPSPFGGMNALSQKAPAFGQSSMGSTAPAFGQSSKPAFGSTSFGSASLGQNRPTFGSASAVGGSTPVFGSSSSIGSNKLSQTSGTAFGSASPLGAVGSKPPGPTQAPATIFGSSNNKGAFGSPSTSTASPFASAGGNATAPKAFGSSPFASAGGATTNAVGSTGSSQYKASPFGAVPPKSANAFGAPSSKPSPFAAATDQGRTAFGVASGNPFGAGSKGSFGSTNASQEKAAGNPFAKASPFTLTSSFVDTASKDANDNVPANKASGASFFGTTFGTALDDAKNAAPSADREEAMEDEAPPAKGPESPEITQSTTPKETPAAQKSIGPGSEVASAWATSSSQQKTPSADTAKGSGLPAFSFTQDTPRPAEAQETPKAVGKSPGETPLPPDATSKDTYTPTNSSTSSIDTSQGSAQNAPLPPDFLKPKLEEKATTEDTPPLPPDFTKPALPSKSPQTSITQETAKKPASDQEAAPLPPDFLTSKTKAPAKKSEPPPPPLAVEESSQFDDEGSGVDVGKELSVDGSPESSFGTKSSSSNIFVSKPTAKPQAAQSVFADVVKPHVPFFEMPPPSKEPESPRSPSPVRSGRGMPDLKPPSMTFRSVSGPAVSKGTQGARKATVGRMQPPPQKFVQPIASFAAGEDSADQRRAAEKKRQEQQAAEEQALSDQDDEYIRAELEAPVQPTTKMPAFLAHTDYTGGVAKAGVPGQIEVVFRDANSMIDTLGLNARALSSWVAGHSIAGRRAGGTSKRQVEDLEDPEGWTMVDVNELVNVENTIQHELSDGAIGNRQGQILTRLMHEMTSEVNKLRRRNEEIARTVDILKKSGEVSGESDEESFDMAPLSAVAAEAQRDLRRSLADFRSNLAAAEEGVALLRTKLSSIDGERSESASRGNVPTVEAVERTIAKMTAMFERKSADLDVLTAQARQLGISDEKTNVGSRASQLTSGFNGRHSRSGSLFESPMTSRPGSSARSPRGTPSRDAQSSKSKLRSSLVLTEQMGDLNITTQDRKPLGKEASSRYVERLKVRKAVKALMKEALGDGKPRVRTLDDY